MTKFMQIDLACPMCGNPLGSGGNLVTISLYLPDFKSSSTIVRKKSLFSLIIIKPFDVETFIRVVFYQIRANNKEFTFRGSLGRVFIRSLQ